MSKKFVAAGVMAASLLAAGAAGAAPTEITMWHAMANTRLGCRRDEGLQRQEPPVPSYFDVQGQLRPDHDVGYCRTPRRTFAEYSSGV